MPLTKFQCKLCGAVAPKKYLQHGMGESRMSWLRRHYKRKHPRSFASWYGRKKTTTKTSRRLQSRLRRIRR